MRDRWGGGVLLVSKPVGITSHDMVERIRRSPLAKGEKVGHTGTLDPFATGLLIVLIGRATRVQRFLTALPKTYRTHARFGFFSDSGDRTGALTATGGRADERSVQAALTSLTGEIRQRVPLTSAVKVEGERLYRRARRGESIETPERVVRIDRLELLAYREREQVAELEVECSSGTYVRQLVADLGTLCGVGAYCDTLERLAIGPFTLERADDQRLIPLAEALSFLPERRLDAREAQLARHGGAVDAEVEGREGPVRLTAGGDLVALAERRDGILKPVTVLAG